MKLRFSYITFILIFLSISVIMSSLLVVYSKQQCRQLYAVMQKIDLDSSAIQAKWSRLLVEQGTCLAKIRVENVAMNNLNMYLPKRKKLAFLQL